MFPTQSHYMLIFRLWIWTCSTPCSEHVGGPGEAAEAEKADEGPVIDADGWEEPVLRRNAVRRRKPSEGGLRETVFPQKRTTDMRFWIGFKWDPPFQQLCIQKMGIDLVRELQGVCQT